MSEYQTRAVRAEDVVGDAEMREALDAPEVRSSVWPADVVLPGRAAAELPSISVVGLGYVGAVSMACLAERGFRMVGVDIDEAKTAAIAAGRSPIVEAQLEELLTSGVAEGLITTTSNLVEAVLGTDVTFISVGTPTADDGGCDLTYIRAASKAIGVALAEKNSFHVVVLRCSVPPGTTLEVVGEEIAAASGRVLGQDFGLCFNPEFLREGVAVADFFAPPKTVIGASDARSQAMVRSIYETIDERVIFTSIEVAEMVKYVDNVWHAAKVTFGNEVGRLCRRLDVDSHAVMDIFVQDTKLNLSPYYLKPGFAFGGSCLPKEVRAVEFLSRRLGAELPMIDGLMRSNALQVREAFDRLCDFGLEDKTVGFLGVTFKPDTDDLRESPTLDLMAQVMDAGVTVRAFDPNLAFGPHLQGQIDYVRHAAPHLATLLGDIEGLTDSSADAFLAGVDVIVVSHATDRFREIVQQRGAGVQVLDLARLFKELPRDDGYHGLSW
ncbi:MAG: nucleotide sugar dehydrogenase [Pseudomonadota bacterium]